MSQSIFTSQTPAVDNANDAVDYTLATTFRTSVDGTVTGIRWWAPSSSVSSPVTLLLYRATSNTTGVELARKVQASASVTLGGWNTVLFDTPVSVTAGTTYVAARWSIEQNYVATGNFWTSAVTNGSLTGLADGTGGFGNGKFESGIGAPTFPTQSFNKGCYFVDVLFDPSVTVTDMAAALSGSGTLAAAAVRLADAAAALSGSGTLAAAALRIADVSAQLAASGALVVSFEGSNTRARSSPLVSARRTSTPGLSARRTSTSGLSARRTSTPTVSDDGG